MDKPIFPNFYHKKPIEPKRLLEKREHIYFDVNMMSLLEVVQTAREMGIKNGEFFSDEGSDSIVFREYKHTTYANPDYEEQTKKYRKDLKEYQEAFDKHDKEKEKFYKEMELWRQFQKEQEIAKAKKVLRENGIKVD